MIFKIEARSNGFLCNPVFIKLWFAAVRMLFRNKNIAKTASDTKRMEIHPHMSVLKLPLLVDFQQKVGELGPSIIIVVNTLN
jgi:hypothetical protein